jgi:peptidoglycan hydrolase-like protein with peptidoglycan-binding domain
MARTLTYGCTGADVRQLQKLLNFHLPPPRWQPLRVDGRFGTKTRDRVIDCQKLSVDQLRPDGIVGPLTWRALLATFGFRTWTYLRPTPAYLPPTLPVSPTTTSSMAQTKPVSTPPDLSPYTLGQRSVQVQVGRQANYFPSYDQPLVLTVQHNWLYRMADWPDLTLSVGGQVALNKQCPPYPPPGVAKLDNPLAEEYRRLRYTPADCPPAVGRWSGQGFAQFGPGGFLKLLDNRLDLLNPALNLMLQKNEAQPWSLGLGVSNQVNYTLWSEKDPQRPDNDLYNLSLFVNTMLVWNVDLSNPQAFRLSVPNLQVLGGVLFTFDVTPEKK